MGVLVNIFSRGEHVKRVELYHMLIEECDRCYYEILTFNYLTRMMVVHLMITVVFHVNVFDWKSGASKVLTPLNIVESACLDWNLHFRIICGQFIQHYEGYRNNMTSRSVDAIGLGPSGNVQGGIRCLSLAKVRIL